MINARAIRKQCSRDEVLQNILVHAGFSCPDTRVRSFGSRLHFHPPARLKKALPARITLGPSTRPSGSGSGMSRYGMGGRLPLPTESNVWLSWPGVCASPSACRELTPAMVVESVGRPYCFWPVISKWTCAPASCAAWVSTRSRRPRRGHSCRFEVVAKI